jgi:GntR family transcriptional regulator
VTAAFDLTIERGFGPLHLAIAEKLSAGIRSGSLEPGTRLPPERQLAESLGVSRMTVRQALGALERQGLVRRVVGRGGGTFVREPEAERHPTGSTGLSAELRRQGLADGTEVVSVDVAPSRRRVAAALGLEPQEPIVVVVRLRLAAGKPLAVERSTLPAKLFPDIEDVDLCGSLYDLMGDGYGLRPVRAVEQLEVVPARASDARALGVREGTPLLLVERTAYAADGTPVEFARDRFRSDRTRLAAETAGVME